ncbi:hypothetical protein Pyn_29166 [Prunus yedoensis var. nudiflora]|uniref:Uncharacterized protein n=1 Tax=Prunus yedoensis var. nudiflora TaxID=2094558 RepID=A0A314YQR3_PRUYE|nr:hypothetical protein Pyn_29166 [Prunus yedoensis var. nudiflora]
MRREISALLQPRSLLIFLVLAIFLIFVFSSTHKKVSFLAFMDLSANLQLFVLKPGIYNVGLMCFVEILVLYDLDALCGLLSQMGLVGVSCLWHLGIRICDILVTDTLFNECKIGY